MAMPTATGASDKPMTIIIGPVTTGGKMRSITWLPLILTKKAKNIKTNPAATRPPNVAGIPHWLTPNEMGAIKAKDEAKNTGTFPRVVSWKSNVPTPAVNKATFGFNPVSSGTRTNAPNATNSIWAPVKMSCHECLGGITSFFALSIVVCVT